MKKTLILLFTIIILNDAFSQKLAESINDFSFTIYNATKPDSGNFFISPFSLNIALSIANEGSKTSTRQEMDKLLSIGNIDNKPQHYRNLIQKSINLNDSDFKNCIEWLHDKSSKNEMLLANSLWINDDVGIDGRYIKTIKEDYGSDIFSFNNHDMVSVNKKLNNWISNKTDGKIPEIKGLHSDIKLSIINAIYFMGEWEIPFDEKKTKEKVFHTMDRGKINIKYMRDQARYRYYEDSNIQSIYLPYKCRQFSMIVILPQKRYGILEIEKLLTIDFYKKMDTSSNFHEVILSFPKFKIESEIFPIEALIKLGYPLMFSDKADFSGISATDSLKIGEIIHKTFIEIDEKKTEAAAVSKVDMVIIGYGGGVSPPPPPPKIFNANHPFIFLIKDNRTNAIIFTGRFVK